MVAGEIEIGERHGGDLDAIDKCAVRTDTPVLQLAILRALQLPPVGRIDAALVAEIARRGPHADLFPVDGERDVGGPVGAGAGHFRTQFHRHFQLLDRGIGELGIVRKLILDIAAGEPDKPGFHAIRVQKRIGNIEQAYDPVGRTEAAGGGDFEARVEPHRHRNFDQILARFAHLALEDDNDFFHRGTADFLVALARLLRLAFHQPRFFQNLDMRGNRRLRLSQNGGDVIDVHRPTLVQKLEHGSAGRRGDPLEDRLIDLRVDDEEAFRHDTLLLPISRFVSRLLIFARVLCAQ